MLSKNYKYILFFVLGLLSILCISFGILQHAIWVLSIPLVTLIVYIGVQHFIIKPILFFWLLLICTPLSTEINISPTLGFDFPTEFLMVVLAALVILLILRNRYLIPLLIIQHQFFLYVVLYFLWIIVTVIFSQNILLSTKFLVAKIWYMLPFIGVPILFIKSIKSFTAIAFCLIIPMLLVTIQAIVRHAFLGFNFEAIKNCLDPFFRNHVMYASVLVCIIVIVWYCIELTPKHSSLKKYLYIILFVFIIGLIFSFSRGGILGLLVAFCAQWIIKKNQLKRVLLSIALFIIIGFAWLSSNNNYLKLAPNFNNTIYHTNLNDHLAATVAFTDVSNAERLYRWVAGFNMILAKPIVGFGPNNFYNYYKSYRADAFKTWVSINEDHSTVHNYFLLVAIEQGLVGLFLFIVLVVTALLICQKLYHGFNSNFYRTVSLMIGVLLSVILSLNLLNDIIETDKIGSIFWLCNGLIFVLLLKKKEEEIALV